MEEIKTKNMQIKLQIYFCRFFDLKNKLSSVTRREKN